MLIAGSWCVEYNDGTFLAQYPTDGPEVPFRAIEWPNVKSLILESQFLRQEFDIIQPQADCRLALQSRMFRDMAGDREVMVFMLITYRNDIIIDVDDPKSYEEACVHVVYWFPNGIIHDCPLYNCNEIAQYASGEIHDIAGRSVMPIHNEIKAKLDAAVV